MGLELPSALTEPLGWVGLVWPEADEDLLFAAAQEWISFSRALQAHGATASAAAAQVWESDAGLATDAFHAWWTGANGPDRRLSDDAEAALLIGAALTVFAGITLALKIAFIVQLVILAIEVGQAVATAFVTFGATTAEIPGFIAIARMACRRLVDEAARQVERVVADVLRGAKDLLRTVERRTALMAEARAARRVEREFLTDLRKVNPRYTSGDPAYLLNCTECVRAFELRRRGLDVTASGVRVGPSAQVLESAFGRSFTPAGLRETGAAFAEGGSRGVVLVDYELPGTHIFSVENVNGSVRFVDPQSGEPDAAFNFLAARSSAYLRTDDLPTDVVQRLNASGGGGTP